MKRSCAPLYPSSFHGIDVLLNMIAIDLWSLSNHPSPLFFLFPNVHLSGRIYQCDFWVASFGCLTSKVPSIYVIPLYQMQPWACCFANDLWEILRGDIEGGLLQSDNCFLTLNLPEQTNYFSKRISYQPLSIVLTRYLHSIHARIRTSAIASHHDPRQPWNRRIELRVKILMAIAARWEIEIKGVMSHVTLVGSEVVACVTLVKKDCCIFKMILETIARLKFIIPKQRILFLHWHESIKGWLLAAKIGRPVIIKVWRFRPLPHHAFTVREQ